MLESSIKKKLIGILHEIKLSKHSKTGFVISTTSKKTNKKVIFLPIRDTIYGIFGAVTVYDIEVAKNICKFLDGKIDFILVDAERKLEKIQNLPQIIFDTAKKTKIFTFKNNDLTTNSADSLITNILKNNCNKKISIVGIGNIGAKLALKLIEREFNVYIASRNLKKTRKIASALNLIKPKFSKTKIHSRSIKNIGKNVDVLVGFTSGIPIINERIVELMNKNSIIIDGGIGTINEDGIKKAKIKNIRIFRLDIRPGFIAEISNIFETEYFLNHIMGVKNLDGIKIVAGGYYGNFGDVIVDNITKPEKIIGIADGLGGVIQENITKQMIRNLKKTKKLLHKSKN